MKYTILAILFMLTFLPFYTFADGDPSSLYQFELDGQVYYVTNPDVLATLMESDACIHNAANGEIEKIYDILHGSCQDLLNDMKQDAAPLTKMVVTARNHTETVLETITSKNSQEDKYHYCLATVEYLSNKLKNQPKAPSHSLDFTADIDSCIKKINIMDSCALDGKPTVPNIKYIENLMNLNANYKGKTFNFNLKNVPRFNHNKVLVFNGNVLVACENGDPKFLIKPAFSGRDECHDGRYQSFSGIGGTPNGIYVVDEKEFTAVESSKQSLYGSHRVRLRPANETDTHGRTSMYIHGTNDPQKTRSAGCISLGINIKEFYDTKFVTGTIPVIVNIGTVYQDWLKTSVQNNHDQQKVALCEGENSHGVWNVYDKKCICEWAKWQKCQDEACSKCECEYDHNGQREWLPRCGACMPVGYDNNLGCGKRIK